MMTRGLMRRAAGEGLGPALLLIAIVGSGMMAERLANGNAAIALLANAIATGGARGALILTFGPLTGAQFNPVVTLALAWQGTCRARTAAICVLAQVTGAVLGVWIAHLMFGLPLLQSSAHARGTFGEWVGELVATFGLIGLIMSAGRHAPAALPYGVAAYITGAYWFTSSSSFAFPAVTLARALTNTFAGIEPAHVIPFILAELAGAAAAAPVFGWLLAREEAEDPIAAGRELASE